MAINSKENMESESVAPPDASGGGDDQNDGNIQEEINLTTAEYNMLDSKLDELNNALDFIEQKNDDIHAQLMELLKSNREIREQLKKDNNGKNFDESTMEGSSLDS